MECRQCGSTEHLLIESRRKTGISWTCRKCNTERARKYRKTKKGKARIYAAVYRSTLKHHDEVVARQNLNYHLRMGHIKKKPCEICGEKKVEAHHEDYKKPLEVHWLCRTHHSDFHNGMVKLGSETKAKHA